eukprot:gene25581-11233_t
MTWDCRSFNEETYAAEIIASRVERFSTIFAVTFLSAPTQSGSSDEYIAAAYSTGVIRLFSLKELSSKWLGRQRLPGSPCLSWKAHEGAVYCLEQCTTASGSILVSGGDDGKLKVWDVQKLLTLLRDPSSEKGSDLSVLEASLQMQIPRIDSGPGGDAEAPGVVSLSLDHEKTIIYAGATDGGLHAFDLLGHLASFKGHLAAVLTTDFCCSTSQLASGSEDATVRLWDCTALLPRASLQLAEAGGPSPVLSPPCTNIINPWDGVELPSKASPNELLQCAKSPHVTAIRFDRDGSWLIIGTGNAALTLWSLTLGQCAQQLSTNSEPQAIHILPGEILVACSEPSLFRFKFSIEQPPSTHEVAVKSCFALDVHPTSGMVAVAGSGGCLDLLLPYGAKVGSVFPTSTEE